MLKVALIGAGKMGISHLAILGAHPDVQVVGVCDTSKIVNDFLSRYGEFRCYTDYQKMITHVKPEAVIVAVPTKFHYEIIKDLLSRNIHVFAEKPFCLTPIQGEELVKMAAARKLITQVGYHNKFIGTFKEVKRILKSGAIGDVHHFIAESYGSVVANVRQETWRSKPDEGGGCLLDYASHVIDLVTDLLGPVTSANGSLLKSIYSDNVEDSVYSILSLSSGISGILSVNWSDDTYRKMSTSITLIGKKGKIISDAHELKVYFKDGKLPTGYSKGWNVRYITDLTDDVDFYLRGEEYSAQMYHFINTVTGKTASVVNTFESAWHTDMAISFIRKAQIS